MSRLEALHAMVQKDPTDALVHYMLANEYFNVGRYHECVSAIERYLGLAEDEGAAYRTLAQALVQMGRVPEARRAYEAGIRAAERCAHPSMVEEFKETLKTLE